LQESDEKQTHCASSVKIFCRYEQDFREQSVVFLALELQDIKLIVVFND